MTTHVLPFTVGVEEEYQIIDPCTYSLSSGAERLIPPLQESLGERVQFGMHLSQVEVTTDVCYSLAEVRRDLRSLRRAVIEAAREQNLLIASAATHPFAPWHEQLLTPHERYQNLEQRYRQLAHEQSIFGCHVHVGIDDRSLALQTLNRVRCWISPLVALSANSPFWQGVDTGYASFRTEVWRRWPLSGLPAPFSSPDEFRELTDTIVATGIVEDITKVYWDVRPSLHYPTLEIRAMDVATTIDESVMLAGLARALVRTCYEQVCDAVPFSTPRLEIFNIAHWFAARYGLSDMLMDMNTLRMVPAAQAIESFLTFLRPALEANGDWPIVYPLVQRQVRDGNGASRQREVFARNNQLSDVVAYVVEATGRD